MSSQVPPQPSDSKSPREHAALVAPQFRLSTLLVLITAVGVLLGAAVVLPPLVTSGLFLLLVAVIAHVAGNY